LSRLEVSSLC